LTCFAFAAPEQATHRVNEVTRLRWRFYSSPIPTLGNRPLGDFVGRLIACQLQNVAQNILALSPGRQRQVCPIHSLTVAFNKPR
jgi:hypothetical protein